MIIRQTQIEELKKVPMLAFENEMVAHLAEFSPALYRVIKEDQMRVVVRFGIEKAEEYGFTFRGPIRLFLELMLLFGSHFDTDPQYPWANSILKTDAPQMERADQLHAQVLDYQEKVSGPNGVNTRKALEELSVIARKPTPLSRDNFEAEARQAMNRAFPQKAEYIGEDAATALMKEGRDEAQKYNLPTLRGEGLIMILMFAFGHGCTDDPLYPWISRTLTDEKIIEPAAREERLEKKALTWLDHVLDNKPREGE